MPKSQVSQSPDDPVMCRSVRSSKCNEALSLNMLIREFKRGTEELNSSAFNLFSQNKETNQVI